jgi:hypothetical protein
MRYCLCVIFLLMSTNNYAEPPSSVASLAWMVGSWKGSLGPQTVEEAWSSPKAGSMDTMIRLSSPEGVHMLELVVIREIHAPGGQDTLMLHLRQFSPSLELVTDQDMLLQNIAAQSVSFAGDENATITLLTYTRMAQDHLQVEVTVATGDVLTAHLHPN